MTKTLIIFLARNLKSCIVLFFFHNMLILFCSIKLIGHKIGIKYDKDPLAKKTKHLHH